MSYQVLGDAASKRGYVTPGDSNVAPVVDGSTETATTASFTDAIPFWPWSGLIAAAAAWWFFFRSDRPRTNPAAWEWGKPKKKGEGKLAKRRLTRGGYILPGYSSYGIVKKVGWKR